MVITGCMSDLCETGEVAVTLPRGMVGLSEATRFSLAKDERNPLFYWLRSLDMPRLAFLVVDPFQFFADYDVEIPDVDMEAIGVNDPEDLALLATVRLQDGGRTATVDLLGPIAVNVRTLTAMQVVPQDSGYSARHPLPRVRINKAIEPVRLVA